MGSPEMQKQLEVPSILQELKGNDLAQSQRSFPHILS